MGSTEDGALVAETAQTRPETLGLASTRWSLHKLAECPADGAERPVRVGPERLRQILHAHDVAFTPTYNVELLASVAARQRPTTTTSTASR